jgi:hypothetical protein
MALPRPVNNTPTKGKFGDKMNGMFDTRSRDSESFHDQLIKQLEDNKKKYDRQLFSDWIVKVYNRCTNVCLKAPQISEDLSDSHME